MFWEYHYARNLNINLKLELKTSCTFLSSGCIKKIFLLLYA